MCISEEREREGSASTVLCCLGVKRAELFLARETQLNPICFLIEKGSAMFLLLDAIDESLRLDRMNNNSSLSIRIFRIRKKGNIFVGKRERRTGCRNRLKCKDRWTKSFHDAAGIHVSSEGRETRQKILLFSSLRFKASSDFKRHARCLVVERKQLRSVSSSARSDVPRSIS